MNVTSALIFSPTKEVDDVMPTAFVITSLLCFSFFFYFIAIMLKVFFTTPHMQENPRYILFVHMLINDTLYFILTNFLIVSSMHSVYLPIIVCYSLRTLGGTSFLVTPYNLALMSLERYIAICFPLRHLQLCTPRRAKYAIAVIWAIGLSLCIISYSSAIFSEERPLYYIYMLCGALKVGFVQNIFRTFNTVVSFTGVALIIVFTYINVMLVSRRIGSGRSSALKAGKTVMLHAFQLILCMVAFISTLTETYFKNYMYYLLVSNYVLFTCVPRFLSPVIYGVRDEVFQKHMRKYCTITRVCRP